MSRYVTFIFPVHVSGRLVYNSLFVGLRGWGGGQLEQNLAVSLYMITGMGSVFSV